MTAMAMASGAKSHEAMMKRARKVPGNTVFFMEGGQITWSPERSIPRQLLSALM